MANPANKAKPGCAKRLVLGLGCGCAYPLAILIFIIGISWYYFAQSFSSFINPVTLPEFSGPEQEDFWTLQEKRLSLEESSETSLSLTPSEFNALLSSITIPPLNGFCLQKLRFIPADGGGVLYIIGSGFFMRSLVFTLSVTTNSDGKPEITKILVNSWIIPASGWTREKVIIYLHSIFTGTVLPEFDLLKSGQASVTFKSDSVTISSSIIKKRP